MWRPLQFMARVLPIKSSSLSVDAAGKIEADHLKSVDNDLPKEVTALRMQLCKWLPRLDSDLTEHPRKHEVLGATTSLLIQGVLLGFRLSQLLHQVVGGHFELGKPLGPKQLMQVLHAVEVVKTVQAALDSKGGMVALTAMHAARACAAQIRRLLLPYKAKLEAAKRLDDAALDRLAAVGLMLHTLTAPPDRMRLTILRLATHVAKLKPLMRDSEHDELCELLWKHALLATWQVRAPAASTPFHALL